MTEIIAALARTVRTPLATATPAGTDIVEQQVIPAPVQQAPPPHLPHDIEHPFLISTISLLFISPEMSPKKYPL